MAGKRIPVVLIVGTSKTGKTTLIERLIPCLVGSGLRVATVKHTHHEPETDRKEKDKDTDRHEKAGARPVILASPAGVFLDGHASEPMGLRDIISRYIHDVDIVICEGYKKETFPKIEMFKAGKGRLPVCLGDSNLIAVVSGTPPDIDVPVFSPDEPERIAEFIIRKMAL